MIPDAAGSNPLQLVGAALAGFLTTFLLTPWIARVARRFEILDYPDGYKAHPEPTPLLGGVSVAAGMACGVAWCLLQQEEPHGPSLAALALGLLVVLGFGLYDDLHGLGPGTKFALQVGAAATAGLVLTLLGVRLRLFLEWPAVPLAVLTMLWIVGVTNAMNFLDNMNGLCVGIGALAAFALAMFNLRTGELTVALASAALGGASIGFLRYNWPRARIFLGDAGSNLIGFALATLSVMGVYTRGAQLPTVAVFAPLFVFAIPVLDAAVVVWLRLRSGQPIWHGDRRHVSHRLVRRGMRPARAVMTLWAAQAACGLAALLLPVLGPTQAPLLAALVLCAIGVLAGAAGLDGLD